MDKIQNVPEWRPGNPTTRNRNRRQILIFLGPAIIGLGFLISTFGPSSDKAPTAAMPARPTNQPSYQIPDLTAFPPPTNEPGPTTVELVMPNSVPSKEWVLRIFDWTTRKPIDTVYGASGSTLNLDVPSGAYGFTALSGNEWDGQNFDIRPSIQTSKIPFVVRNGAQPDVHILGEAAAVAGIPLTQSSNPTR